MDKDELLKILVELDYGAITSTKAQEKILMLADGWVKCAESLPPLRKRVIVTDGIISTIGWISDYRKGWEGWITLDNEYLNDIVAWQEFPHPTT